MENLFSTYILCADDNGQSVLQSYLGPLHPGKPFTVDKNDKILIGGGFPALSPDSALPLSPTLKLNSDLTFLTETELKKVALAELARFQSINFRSYDVDVDLSVCVIAANSRQIKAFEDIYGGILEIGAVVVNGDVHDKSGALNISIEAQTHGYQVRYRESSPVNLELCTYCGACGAACPEKCISENLKVDFTVCTFCKECEKACSEKCIDIYGFEEKSMNVPAIILLDGVELDLPENKSGIYIEKQITDYFKTLFPASVEEVVCHNNTICQYSGRLNEGCRRCVDSCPHDALGVGSAGIKVDHLLCEECGNCIAVCPTGAMQYGRFTDQSLVEYFQKIRIPEGADIVIGSEKDLHALWWQRKGVRSENIFFLEYPNVTAIPYVYFLLMFAMGARRVIVLADDKAGENSPLRQQIIKANYVVSSLFDVDLAVSIDLKGFEACLSNQGSHPLHRFYSDLSYQSRRSKLAGILEFLIPSSGRTLTSEGLLDGLVDMSCDSAKCTQCLACLNECGMQALQAEEKDMSLTYSGGLCVGCGVCVTVCPEKALSMTSTVSIDKEFFQRRLFAQADPAVCRKCGKVFGSRQSLDRVMQILMARETVNREHFEYCSTCRVTQIFETEEI